MYGMIDYTIRYYFYCTGRDTITTSSHLKKMVLTLKCAVYIINFRHFYRLIINIRTTLCRETSGKLRASDQ